MIAEYEAKRLNVQQIVAKAKARAKVFEESEFEDEKLRPQKEAKPGKQTDVDHYLQGGTHQKQRLDNKVFQIAVKSRRKSEKLLEGIFYLVVGT